jgi:hexosaminidase
MNIIDNKTKKETLFLILFALSFINSMGQANKPYDPNTLRIEWNLLKNPNQNDTDFLCRLILTNNSQESLPSSGWKIFFNLRYHGYQIQSAGSLFEIKHISGELFCLSPTSTFQGIKKGQFIAVDYTGEGKIANYQDTPAGLFWVYDFEPDVAIKLNKLIIHKPLEPVNDTDYSHRTDIIMAFNENSKIKDIPKNLLPKIFPTPLEYHEDPGYFELNQNTTIHTAVNCKNEADYLANEIQQVTGKKPVINDSAKTDNIIWIEIKHMQPEAYYLQVRQNEIHIEAGDGAGIFYGIQSFKSILAASEFAPNHSSVKIPCTEIHDAPQFELREFMLDVSRNFQSKEEILRILDLMSIYKLNVFHFHLTDDEGWRLEIPDLPELTDIGARRGYPFSDNQQLIPSYGSGPDGLHSPGTGYYSTKEFIDILKYATERHILVIPEIESPGHAMAAVKAMNARYNKFMQAGNKAEAEKFLLYDRDDQSVFLSNQGFNDNVMNPALPSTYLFMEKVINEIITMYRQSGAPLKIIHVGGDEVPHGSWERSPSVAKLMKLNPSISNTRDLWAYYFRQLKSLLKERGLSMNGWEELDKGVQNQDDSGSIIHNAEFIREKVLLDAWWNICDNKDAGYNLANAGYKVVLCPVDYFYLDLAYSKSFNEPGDAWVGYLNLKKVFSFVPFNYYKNTREDIAGNLLPKNYFTSRERLIDSAKTNIVGLKAALWEENIGSAELLEYMALPRLLAVAERAWAKEPQWALEKDSNSFNEVFQHSWSVFVNVVAKRELPKLDIFNHGYNYRIPTAVAVIRNGEVAANCEFPGFLIHYTCNDSIPSVKSSIYHKPLSIKGVINFRVFNSMGRGGETISILNR